MKLNIVCGPDSFGFNYVWLFPNADYNVHDINEIDEVKMIIKSIENIVSGCPISNFELVD